MVILDSSRFFRWLEGARGRPAGINVGLDGETRRGKNAVAAERVLTGQAGSFDKSQPFFNAARLGTVAIMIEDAFAPSEAKVRIFAAGQNRRVFDGYSALIIVAVQRPRLKLAARELAFVHEQVKRMFMVIALIANGMKAGDELCLREQRLFLRSSDRRSHRLNSIPS